MLNEIQEIIDEQKEKFTSDEYLKLCTLTKKLSEEQESKNFYDIFYLESFITKTEDNFQVEFKTYNSYIKIDANLYKMLSDKIIKDGYVKLCTHSLNDTFDRLKIVKQELWADAFCNECSECNMGTIEIKNNVIILKIKQVD